MSEVESMTDSFSADETETACSVYSLENVEDSEEVANVTIGQNLMARKRLRIFENITHDDRSQPAKRRKAGKGEAKSFGITIKACE